MNKFKSACCISILAVVNSTPTISAEHAPLLDRSLFAIGGGVSYNKDEDNEFGFQIFGAYELSQVNLMEGVDSAVEFGIMDFGFSEDDTGIWISYAVDGAIDDQFGWLAQVGWDFGDDNGLLFGGGVKFRLDQATDIRIEYVIRDEVDSLQANLLYHF